MTPRELGYRMPAEWEPHQATWVSWPHKEASWPGKLETVFPIFSQMVAALARSETVHINVCNDEMEHRARSFLHQARAAGDIRFHHFPTNDAWCRDYGAIFVRRVAAGGSPAEQSRRGDRVAAATDLAATDWGYNAWGDKYPPYDLDNQIPAHMAEVLGTPRFFADMILEGGSIDVNGEGVLLTSEACLLNPNRNPHLSQADIEQRLRDYLGADQILWLGEGIVGDDTDGHVDDLARFAGPETIVTVVEQDPADDNYRPLQDNLERLHSFRSPAGRPFRIIELPMPRPVVWENQRLPASYANFYVANTTVLLPTYRDPQDIVARELLSEVFPERTVVAIDCTDLVWGLGAFHCLTQQVPLA
jgi:agmatine deiminase